MASAAPQRVTFSSLLAGCGRVFHGGLMFGGRATDTPSMTLPISVRGGLILLSTAATLLVGLPTPSSAQGSSRAEALDEIRSLQVEVATAGSAPAGLARAVEAVVLEELERARVPEDLSPPRPRDCCILRLDLRIASSRAGNVYGTGYSMRLDLGYPERVGRVDAWVLLWHGRTLDGVVDPAELSGVLRDRARELAVEFVDRYRERVPLRD